MKYMHFNSSCSYTALAMLLEDKGIETEDVDIALEMGLPWMFAEQDGSFLAGPMLQGKEWFDIYLNPKGLCINEEYLEKKDIPSYLQGMCNCVAEKNQQAYVKCLSEEHQREHGKCMIGAHLQGNAGKHAIVFYKYDGLYHFYNPIRDGSDDTAKIAFNETQLLQVLDDITIVGSIAECPKSEHDKSKLFDESAMVLRKMYSEIVSFSKNPHSDEEYKEAMDRIFRPLLLDGITMLEISGNNDLAYSFRKIQRDFLDFMKGAKKGILADVIVLENLKDFVSRYEELIMEHTNS